MNAIGDHGAKKMSLATIKIALEADPSALELVIREVLHLPTDKLEELRSLLENVSLTNIINSMKLVNDRLEFLAGLEILLFDPEHSSNVLERSHLHKLVESQPWLFGEEFATHVSDESLSALLRQHMSLLGRDELEDGPVLDEDGRIRRIDFMFGRVLETNRERREHLVVELKRPSLTVGRDAILQVQDYARVVAHDPRFDITSVKWDFVLMATTLDDVAENLLGQKDRDPDLLHDKDGVRIWVRKWATVIEECKHRLSFIREQLDYDPTAGQALRYLCETHPEYVPPSVADSL